MAHLTSPAGLSSQFPRPRLLPRGFLRDVGSNPFEQLRRAYIVDP